MTTETFIIEIRERGATAAATSIDRLGAAAQKSANTMAFFRKALVAFSALRLAENVVSFVDTVNRMDNRLRVATKSSEQFARAQQFLSQVSRKSGTDLEGNTIIYGRLLQSTNDLKLKTADLELIMRGLSASIKVGGATSQEARNAMIQFSQSLASGALRGDELRSVAEQIPALANAIGKEFGVSGGKLLAFAKANPGILETEKVLNAVKKAAVGLEAQAAKMPKTMIEGFIAIKNSTLELLREVNQGTGIFQLFTQALLFVADNLKVLILLISLFAAVKLVPVVTAWSKVLVEYAGTMIQLTRAVWLAVTAQTSLNVAMLANPLGALLIAIAAVVGVLVVLYNTVPGVKAFFDGLFSLLMQLGSYLLNVLTPVWNAIVGAFTAMAPAVNAVILVFSAFYESLKVSITAFVEATGGSERWYNALAAIGEILPLIGSVLAILVAVALAPFVLGAAAVVEVLYQLGLATEATVVSSRKAVAGFLDFNKSLFSVSPAAAAAKASSDQVTNSVNMTGSAAAATSASVSGATTAVKDFGVAASEPASILDRLNTTVDATSKSAEKAATNFGALDDKSASVAGSIAKTDEALNKLNPSVDKSYVAIVKAGNGYEQAAPQADHLADSINALAAAYRALASAKASAGDTSSVGGAPSAVAGQRASGGPVSSGKTYLVGEDGPELFTPTSAGSIMSNASMLSSGGSAANDNGSRDIIQAAKYVVSSAREVIKATRGRSLLPGDTGYASQYASVTAKKDGGYGGIATAGYDANKPMDRMIGALVAQVALGTATQKQLEAGVARQDALIKGIKDVRENTAAYANFTKSLPGMKAEGGPAIDFQTKTPFTGGKDSGRHDPYGLMSRTNSQSSAGAAESTTPSSTSEKAGDTKINVNFFVKDAQSFRQNQAQVDNVILGAVKRGQRRVGVR